MNYVNRLHATSGTPATLRFVVINFHDGQCSVADGERQYNDSIENAQRDFDVQFPALQNVCERYIPNVVHARHTHDAQIESDVPARFFEYLIEAVPIALEAQHSRWHQGIDADIINPPAKKPTLWQRISPFQFLHSRRRLP